MVSNKKKVTESNSGKLKNQLGVVVAALGFLLYIGTINYSYTLDDFGVIKENFVVKQGIKGIPTILKTSYRYGTNYEYDQLYRPLPLILYALEWQFFPNSPGVAHLINVLFYAFAGYLLFRLLCRLFNDNFLIPFITGLLFMAHPVHTEVVASIKSGDEIISFLLSIAGINLLLDYLLTKKNSKMLLSLSAFFLALLSKESALTIIAVIPFVLFVFKGLSFRKSLFSVLPFIVVGILYLVIRSFVLHGSHPEDKMYLALDNVLATAPDFFSRIGTAIYVLGRYLLLLFFPLHLSADYSYSEITLLTFSDYRVIISLLIYTAIFIYAMLKIKTKDVIAFSIIYFLITMSIASNLPVLTGTVMAERLLFTPSLGFCLCAGILFAKFFESLKKEVKYSGVMGFLKHNKRPFIYVIPVLALYSFKTITRIPVWKDDYAIAQSSVLDAPNSARTHSWFADALKNTARTEEDPQRRSEIYNQAITEGKKAIDIFPCNVGAYRWLGGVYYNLEDTINAQISYASGLKCDPENSAIINDEGAMLFQQKKYMDARNLFLESLKYEPTYPDALKNLGGCYLVTQQVDSALFYLKKSTEYETLDDALIYSYHLIGQIYQANGAPEIANQYFKKEKILETRGR